MMRAPMRALAVVLGLAAAVAALPGCGGSSGSDGAPTAISQGVVTRVDPLTVTGVPWSTDVAAVDLDGMSASPEVLAVGMLVTVRGTRSGDEAVAEEITYDPALVGPVTAVEAPELDDEGDLLRLAFEVMGQPVLVEPGVTVFGGELVDAFDLGEGDFVEVSGLREPDGTLCATRIDGFASIAAVQVSGVAEGTQNEIDAGSLAIGPLEVSFDPGDVPGGLAPGDLVEVKGATWDAGALTLVADEIAIEPQGFEGNVQTLEIEGIVSDYFSDASFAVAGQPVTAGFATVRREPEVQTLANFVRDGRRVEVEGRLDAGLLRGVRLLLRERNARIVAPLDETSDGEDGRTLTLEGVTARVDDGTRLFEEDGTPLAFEELVADDPLVVRGVELGGSDVRALEVERLGATPAAVEIAARVQGFTLSGDVRDVTLLGVRIETEPEPTTRFVGFPDVGETAFYLYLSSNPAVRLEVELVEGAGVADEVELLAAD